MEIYRNEGRYLGRIEEITEYLDKLNCFDCRYLVDAKFNLDADTTRWLFELAHSVGQSRYSRSEESIEAKKELQTITAEMIRDHLSECSDLVIVEVNLDSGSIACGHLECTLGVNSDNSAVFLRLNEDFEVSVRENYLSKITDELNSVRGKYLVSLQRDMLALQQHTRELNDKMQNLAGQILKDLSRKDVT